MDRLSRNKRYLHILKLYLYNILENENSPYKHIYDVFAIIIVITSSLSVITTTFFSHIERLPPDLDKYLGIYEDFALFFFLIEYILRWWVISDFLTDFQEELRNHKRHNIGTYLLAFKKAIMPKILWMIKPSSIINLLAILPLLRPLRAFRLLLAIKILKVFRYSSVFKNVFLAIKEGGFLIFFIFSLIFLIIFVSAIFTYIFEYDAGNKDFSSFTDALYWAIITSMTVGYGDIVPQTTEGRFIASFLSISVVIFVSALTATFSATFVQRLLILKEGAVKMRDLKNHIVICGYNETSEEVLELIQQSKIDREKPVVLITNYDKSQLDIDLSDFILYKKGDFVNENILMDVAIDKASDVIIVAEKVENLSDRNIDARTALTAMLVKDINPTARLYVEVLLDENAEIFKKRLTTKDILIHGQIIGKMMFATLLNPGATTLIKTLIDQELGIKKIKLSEIGSFEKFKELLEYVRTKNYLPIAVERKKKIILNPQDDFILEKNDYIFLIQGVETE